MGSLGWASKARVVSGQRFRLLFPYVSLCFCRCATLLMLRMRMQDRPAAEIVLGDVVRATELDFELSVATFR